ncbi:hypothetical protein DFS34DRAFT_646621 [Phlyctochytrium arcticum]|nr:hypothetical protein DFS34DRAFT_646621 [Phlyctochytrium arcticum]
MEADQAIGDTAESDFNLSILAVRNAHTKRITKYEEENRLLRGELSRRDNEIKDLRENNKLLDLKLATSYKRIQEMSRAVSKLASFKQSVMESLASDKEANETLEHSNSLREFQYDFSPERRVDERDDVGRRISIGRTSQNESTGPSRSLQQNLFSGDTTTRLFAYDDGISQKAETTPNNIYAFQASSHQRSMESDQGGTAFQKMTNLPIAQASTPPARNAREGASRQQSESTPHRNMESSFQTSPHTSPYHSSDHRNTSKRLSGVTFAGVDVPRDVPAPVRDVNSERLMSLPGEGHPGTSNSVSTDGVHPSGAVDGREFFRKARVTLSYDEFTNLLWNVKAYNNREQSRIRTLDNLSRALGDKHRDLYEEFEKLVQR